MIIRETKFALKKVASYFRHCLSQRKVYCRVKAASGRINKAYFYIAEGSNLCIGKGVVFQNCIIRVDRGTLELGDNVIIGHDDPNSVANITIDSGRIEIKNNSRVRANIRVRFGGEVRIGSYTAINEGSELRCDDSITIGSYCMISYGCKIYDTNTHCILPCLERRALTVRDYPLIGREYSKPRTANVIIGDDVWMGIDSMVLKGVSIGSRSIIGAKALVAKPGIYDHDSLIASPVATIIKSIRCANNYNPDSRT